MGGSSSACSTTTPALPAALGRCPGPRVPSWRGPMLCPSAQSRTAVGQSPPLCPSTLQRERPQLLLACVGVGSRAGGNSSGRDPEMLQLFPNSRDSCPIPCTQGRVSGVPDVPPSWQPLCHTSGLGQHPPPCAAPVGCGLLAGPPAVPKRPWGGAARRLPGVLTAPSVPTLKVLCSVYWFPSPRHDKGLFPVPRLWCIGSVLLMWPFLWYRAFPLPQAKASVHLTWWLPAPPSLLKPSFRLQHGFSCCGDHLPSSWLVPGEGKEGCPEPRRERQTPAQPWGGGGGGSGSRLCSVASDKTFPPLFWFPSSLFQWQLVRICPPANPCQALLSPPSPCLWKGLLAFAMPSASTTGPPRAPQALLCHPWSPGLPLFPCQGYRPLLFEPELGAC